MLRRSCFTLGSVFSLIVTAAVVCGTNTWQVPRVMPLSRTISRAVWVMSISCWGFSVRTVMVLRLMNSSVGTMLSPCSIGSLEGSRNGVADIMRGGGVASGVDTGFLLSPAQRAHARGGDPVPRGPLAGRGDSRARGSPPGRGVRDDARQVPGSVPAGDRGVSPDGGGGRQGRRVRRAGGRQPADRPDRRVVHQRRRTSHDAGGRDASAGETHRRLP